MRTRAMPVVGPALPPEESTGLPIDTPPSETVAPSGVAGDNYAQEGSGFGPKADGPGIADWHGESVPGAPPPVGGTGPLGPQGDEAYPAPKSEPIDQGGKATDRDLGQQQLMRLLLHLDYTLSNLQSVLTHDRPMVTRPTPAVRATTFTYTPPTAGSIKVVGHDDSRRVLYIINEDANNGVRIGPREAVENGQGFLLPKGMLTPIAITSAGSIHATATGGTPQVSGWVESGEAWQVPLFGSYKTRQTPKPPARQTIGRHDHHPAAAAVPGGGGGVA